MKAVLFVVALLVVAQAKVSWPYENCGKGDDLIEFSSLFLSVKPAKGSTPEITLSGDVADHLEFSEVTVTAKLNGITMQVLHTPYTSIFDGGDPFTYVYNNEIPSFTPSVYISI